MDIVDVLLGLHNLSSAAQLGSSSWKKLKKNQMKPTDCSHSAGGAHGCAGASTTSTGALGTLARRPNRPSHVVDVDVHAGRGTLPEARLAEGLHELGGALGPALQGKGQSGLQVRPPAEYSLQAS